MQLDGNAASMSTVQGQGVVVYEDWVGEVRSEAGFQFQMARKTPACILDRLEKGRGHLVSHFRIVAPS